jgi:hypothetical protein
MRILLISAIVLIIISTLFLVFSSSADVDRATAHSIVPKLSYARSKVTKEIMTLIKEEAKNICGADYLALITISPYKESFDASGNKGTIFFEISCLEKTKLL